MRPDIYMRLGQKSFIDGDLPASIEAFSTAIEDAFNPLQALLSRGVAYLKLGRFDEAISDFTEVLEEGGDCERGFFYRGITYLNQDKYEAAIDDLNNTLAINSDRGAASLARGMAHSELSHEEEAERDMQSCYVHNNVIIGDFVEEYAISKTMFNRSMALLDGNHGPWSLVLTEDEIRRMVAFAD